MYKTQQDWLIHVYILLLKPFIEIVNLFEELGTILCVTSGNSCLEVACLTTVVNCPNALQATFTCISEVMCMIH